MGNSKFQIHLEVNPIVPTDCILQLQTLPRALRHQHSTKNIKTAFFIDTNLVNSSYSTVFILQKFINKSNISNITNYSITHTWEFTS